MAETSIIIIGAGLAGLSTGCYGQMNAYKTKIFELQNKPGGVCVSWKRNGYSFDYAAHNIFGVSTKPTGSLYNQVWQELGALKGTRAYVFDEFVQVEDTDGKVFTVYSDIDKLERHMKELSPADAKLIEGFTKTIRKLSGKDVLGSMSGGIGAKLKMLPLMGSLMKYSKINLKEYAQNFSDPFLKKAIPTIQYDIEEVPVIVPIVFISTLSVGDAGWPIGGSAAFSHNIEKRYIELGGEVHYNSKVTKIIVENDVAKGVQLEDGSEHFADLVISAADGYSTIFGMLNEKYINQFIRSYYQSYSKTQSFGLEIWYGVNRSFSDEPHAMVLFLEQPIKVEGEEKGRLDIEILNFDPTLSPQGKTVIKVNFESTYDYWKELSANQERYRAQKQEIADEVAERLEKRFPGFKKQIEAVDVATPVTVEHWTGGFRGFAQPWPPNEELAKEINKNGVSKTLPGLQNFYMVGQWAGGTYGISTVCLMGRDLIRELCKKDDKPFKVTIA
ncbi:MAG: NAD(P)/FAD-dependent oxidoreductase [Candidatus Bathyarchaeota archaeon]|nr:NAD(P)/FAD-dependent oxidoreductase [Candidatus Bathyarchaeota archaeon]